MRKRIRIPSGLLLVLGSTFMLSCRAPEMNSPRFRNVVVIISDDHSTRTLGCYGNEVIRTPNIDRIASAGTRFTNAYANAPICSGSRQSLLTGKYPHASGVNLLFTPFNDDMNYTVAEHMRAHGISTAMIGKTHWNDWIYYNYWEQWPDYGFDTVITRAQWRSHLENQPPSEIPEGIATRANTPHEADIRWAKNAQMLPAPFMDEDSDGTFLARSAIRFMDEQQGDRFFLWVAFHEPHAPFNFPVEYAGSYDPREVPLPEGSDEDQRWVPEIFRDLTEAERRGIISSYYTSVEYMDKNVGLILDAMEDRGLDQETLVVYLSDHGYLLNEHSRFEKHSMWAESIKAPLIFRGSGIQQGTESNALAEFVDLTPTIYAAMGLPMHDGLQGQSLLPILQGGDDELRAYAFAEYLEDNMAMVASRRWKYIFTTGKRDLGLGYSTGQGPSGVVHMLYNLENDPRETSNLAYNTAFLPMVDSLQQVMLDHFLNTHPNAGYVPSGLNTVGKLIWFCEPTDVGEEPGGELQRIFEKEDIYQ